MVLLLLAIIVITLNLYENKDTLRIKIAENENLWINRFSFPIKARYLSFNDYKHELFNKKIV